MLGYGDSLETEGATFFAQIDEFVAPVDEKWRVWLWQSTIRNWVLRGAV